MMLQLLENLSGTGVVHHKGGDLVGEVQYDIQVYQGRVDASTLAGHATLPGLKRIEGHVTGVDNFALMLGAARLTLRLGDGRQLDLQVGADGSVIANSDLY